MRPSVSVSRRNLLLGAGALGAAATVGIAVRPAAAVQPTAAVTFAHPGLLHTQADFTRIRNSIAAGDAVVTSGWQRLTGNGRSHATWKPRPLPTVVRGGDGQNYAQFFIDVHAAYQNALRWRITDDPAHARAAVGVLNAWSSTLKQITGNADRFLAAGIYGYQLANAAELLRGYEGFDLAGTQNLLRKVFYPLNDQFLTRHNDAYITNYWANWDLSNLAAVMAIGILCDDRSLFDRAVTYLRTGPGNGSIPHAVPFLHGDQGELGQWQESGRDQGHSVMGIGLLGALCEMAWNQGVDLYGFDDNRFLKGAEYVARYNLGREVPFTTYEWGTGVTGARRTQTVISPAGRGQVRPVWEQVFHHYVNRRGLAAPNVTAMARSVRAEGGGGDYGSASGGYDQLGFGTLMFTRPRTKTKTKRQR
ncbi:alginate lyase family protein [Kineosporia mesophila]|uniref:Alginate lyase family protein n=1 Tax=Kineosporia mesophila TaxID=566012 RepID=A0ABP7ARV3_9ACTN|nr:alginate lyase family protein [Kineosporia mesophila]MCD5349072.1 alginate lyase family protein [Kineosporia mesophila]